MRPAAARAAVALGFLAAGVVLFVAFGSLLAMLLPLLTAGVSLGTGIAIVGVLSHVIDMNSFSGQLALLIGARRRRRLRAVHRDPLPAGSSCAA